MMAIARTLSAKRNRGNLLRLIVVSAAADFSDSGASATCSPMPQHAQISRALESVNGAGVRPRIRQTKRRPQHGHPAAPCWLGLTTASHETFFRAAGVPAPTRTLPSDTMPDAHAAAATLASGVEILGPPPGQSGHNG
jgi:hypothetical protein